MKPDKDQNWLEAGAKNDKTPYQSIQMLVRPDGEITLLKVLGGTAPTWNFILATSV